MRVYVGTRHGGIARVYIADTSKCPVLEELPLRLDLWNHSPDGFNWGYSGSGPAQLALAILADCVDQETATRLHQRFKSEVIALLEQGKPWCMTQGHVHDWLTEYAEHLQD